jgi:hypothetical protein
MTMRNLAKYKKGISRKRDRSISCGMIIKFFAGRTGTLELIIWKLSYRPMVWAVVGYS